MEPIDSLSEEAQREREALQSTTERLRAERLQIEAQNAEIQALIARQEQLKRHLQEFLAYSRAERKAIDQERTRILTAGSPR